MLRQRSTGMSDQNLGVEAVERTYGQVPCVGETPLAEIVRACHERTIDEGLSALAIAGLDRARLDAVLVYCAEQRCEHAQAICPGCRRESLSAGIETFDDFLARHAKIECLKDKITLHGPGEKELRVSDFATLREMWAGEEYWYWARRVLRKLRHGIRRANAPTSRFAGEGETPSIILVEPQLADNIGMAARAMANFGLDSLSLVNPRDGWPNEKARIAASGAHYVIDDAKSTSSVDEAVGELDWICATTARQRDLRKPVMTPEQATSEMARRIDQGGKCGILFGPEASGLASKDLECADAIVMIPVNNRFASLNLAQAVLILGYSWMKGRGGTSLGRTTQFEKPQVEGLNLGDDRPATKEELLGFFNHLEGSLDEKGFFNPPHRRPTVVRNLRSMFTRMTATAQEVRTLRGIVATLSRSKHTSGKS